MEQQQQEVEFPYYLQSPEQYEEFLHEYDEPNIENYDSREPYEQAMAEWRSLPQFRLPNGSRPVFVNVHEIWQSYGGPEEGGWWIHTGEPMESVLVDSYEQAREVYVRLRQEWEDTSRVPVTSVIYSGGIYEVSINSAPADHWPATRPRYE